MKMKTRCSTLAVLSCPLLSHFGEAAPARFPVSTSFAQVVPCAWKNTPCPSTGSSPGPTHDMAFQSKPLSLPRPPLLPLAVPLKNHMNTSSSAIHSSVPLPFLHLVLPQTRRWTLTWCSFPTLSDPFPDDEPTPAPARCLGSHCYLAWLNHTHRHKDSVCRPILAVGSVTGLGSFLSHQGSHPCKPSNILASHPPPLVCVFVCVRVCLCASVDTVSCVLQPAPTGKDAKSDKEFSSLITTTRLD
ncbi:uncharacterized protein LY79DRAFT_311004 [Colletotrichum navitas]|uniref:Secreted protein n=1 Tax=Colletotrichum navitas TaxID=681940 RepID=A0AAD8PTE2_9PEZI|nr:uncharacterized protein LY79DRAFT_311004 [Colletotrichum navitas]KAK1580345.1 hypothetical protein LY79DRAFT_311004 [Colletotrichum navitas]